jgi:hypothetical protein
MSIAVCAQKFVGVITDVQTGEKLAFVNIIFNSKNQGTTTDFDGNFVIEDKTKIEFLRCSYLGYLTLEISKEDIAKSNNIKIKLTPDKLLLQEIDVLPGENPAHRIIELVIKNSEKNNPENIKTFTYTSYNKMYFTVDVAKLWNIENQNAGSIKNDFELIFNDVDTQKQTTTQQDSLIQILDLEADILETKTDTIKEKRRQRTINFFNSQHLFLTESVTERRYKAPKNNKETIVAQRMSGLKNPAFLLLASQFQSMSFYSDYIGLLNKKFLSPVSKGSPRQYFFNIEDTLYNEKGDTIFSISYRPLRGKNFDGLKGVLHINSNGYAIQSIIARPYEKHPLFDVYIQQKFEFLNDSLWFPVQLNTDLILNALQIGFDSINSPIIGIGKSYIYDVMFDTTFRRKDFNQIEVEVKHDASKKTEEFWNLYRNEPLSEKDLKTYRVIDSLGKEFNLDGIMDGLEILISGAIPIGFVNIDLNSIYWYDDYQGHCLGLGISTNRRLSRFFSLRGYFSYGFGDKAWKYGGGFSITPMPSYKSNLEFSFDYHKNLQLSDNFNFYSANKLALTNTFIAMFLSEMDSVTIYSGATAFTIFKYLNTKIRYSYIDKNIIHDNRYEYTKNIIDRFTTHEVGLHLRYAYKERFMETPKGNRLSLGTKYPILHLNIITGYLPKHTDYDYIKIETAVSKTFTIRNFGETSIFFFFSYLLSDTPYSNLYMITGTNSWLNFNNVFNTMGTNEFITDRYASVFLYHFFKILLFKIKKFAPEIVVMTAAAWGDARLAQNPSDPSNPDNLAKIMNKGYFESGLQINYILTYKKFIGLGTAIYYRYGPEHYNDKEIKNWGFKLTVTAQL